MLCARDGILNAARDAPTIAYLRVRLTDCALCLKQCASNQSGLGFGWAGWSVFRQYVVGINAAVITWTVTPRLVAGRNWCITGLRCRYP